jgi:uncharacterized protein
MSVSRRGFLGTAAFTGAAAVNATADTTTSAGPLPTRILGRTGAKVTILAFGTGSRFLSYEEDQAIEALTHALDLGIGYVDTAYSYGNGKSEGRVGKVMATRRKQVFLATKVQERNGDKALAIIEGSLKRLQTDQLDLIHIHQLMGEDDLANIEAKDGVLNTLLKLRDQKVTKAIGITCHHDPHVLKTALERHDFDCTQMALNAALVGMKPGGKAGMVINPEMKSSFQSIALPVALRKNMGVLAMKVFAADGLQGQAKSEKLLYYSLSLPVAAAVVGMPTLHHIEENTRMARAFQALPSDEMRGMEESLASRNKLALDLYFQHHSDHYPAV